LARRRRLTGPLIAALGVHALFAVFFAYGGRAFRAPADMRAIDITLVPEPLARPKPPPAAPPKAGPRSQAASPSQAPAVLTQPARAASQQAQANAPSTDDGASANFRAALRASAGCAHADAMGLTKAERDRCAERQLAWGKGAPAIQTPMDPDKRAYFDAVVAAYDQQSHGGPMAGSNPTVGCSMLLSGLKLVKAKPPPHGLKLGPLPCYIIPPQGMFTEESGIEPPPGGR
jgi:hypothetical protein